MKSKRIMKIRYPHKEELKDKLHSRLDMCCIPHVICDDTNGYTIFIDKGKCTWNQVMQEVNSVHAVMFRYENNTYIKDGQVYVDLGTIRI